MKSDDRNSLAYRHYAECAIGLGLLILLLHGIVELPTHILYSLFAATVLSFGVSLYFKMRAKQ